MESENQVPSRLKFRCLEFKYRIQNKDNKETVFRSDLGSKIIDLRIYNFWFLLIETKNALNNFFSFLQVFKLNYYNFSTWLMGKCHSNFTLKNLLKFNKIRFFFEKMFPSNLGV